MEAGRTPCCGSNPLRRVSARGEESGCGGYALAGAWAADSKGTNSTALSGQLTAASVHKAAGPDTPSGGWDLTGPWFPGRTQLPQEPAQKEARLIAASAYLPSASRSLNP